MNENVLDLLAENCNRIDYDIIERMLSVVESVPEKKQREEIEKILGVRL